MPAAEPAITVTVDLEDHRPSADWPVRYPALMRRLLDHLDQLGARATVFVVGEVARCDPSLVREVAARGHELGLHSWRHTAVFREKPDEFAREVAAARTYVEDLVGAPVVGFRAPAGTLVPSCVRATDLLAEAGFVYSASILPARTTIVGFPGAPERPFRWPSGLIELPCPAARVGRLGIPYLGGTFLRTLPPPVMAWWSGRADAEVVQWSYLHPYDIDTDEPFWVLDDVGWWGSPLVWANRKSTLRRLDWLVRGRVAPPLGVRVATLGALETWDPGNPGRSSSPGVGTLSA